ncbi:hypothetical protein Cl131_gp122 [Aphanizomenon phage vB_AphaS-CL131]|nr:hypothetical protein Cl131_gp122 [Aphanizomenon phage vB_AphaS-CL131]
MPLFGVGMNSDRSKLPVNKNLSQGHAIGTIQLIY